jgi:hypothetical protein
LSEQINPGFPGDWESSTEKGNAVAYLGCKPELRVALNDRIGIEPEDV